MKSRFYFLIVLAVTGAILWGFLGNNKRSLSYAEYEKTVCLNDNGFDLDFETKSETVGDFFKEKNIKTGDYDEVFPGLETKIFPKTKIFIRRAAKIQIKVDGEKIERFVLGRNVEEAIAESEVILGRLDKTEPEKKTLIENDLVIIVTRINVEEVVEKEEIDFKITVKEDKKLGWREKKIETPGEKGEKEVKYRITYKDSKEVSRVKLETNITREPVAQVETQGIYMKLGKDVKGQATWYAYKGGMFAASTTIPKGEFVKVTSLASGKSVVVQINDYGPHGKGRIIDLDKVAFQKLAPIGAGVISVKVEHILN